MMASTSALAVLVYTLSLALSSALSETGHWKKTWILETDKLPTRQGSNGTNVDFRMMASVGNGHVASVLYSPVVYMNGLYNGPVGWTHRAAIQSIHDVKVHVQGMTVTRHYALDMWRAVFTETISAKGIEVKVMTYAHQRLVQLLVTEIHVTRTDNGRQEFVLPIDRSAMNSTIDLSIEKPGQVHDITGCEDSCMHTHGHTYITETPEAKVGEVHIYWTDIPSTLTLARDQQDQKWLFFSSYDKEDSKARHAFKKGLNHRSVTPSLPLETHAQAWEDRWNSGRIDVTGDDDLATTIHSSLYYILLSLPSQHSELPLDQFYGLSPGSLARGANWTDYQGHVFWDMETWMYPPILAFFPGLARDMLSYRIYGGQGASVKAREHGYEGWQFPWESAYTGYEMTPLICVPCREYEQHITGDIAFAAQQYWAVTRDERWLKEDGGIRLVTETAEFWASRAEYNEEKDRYDINGVMPPDEYAEHVNNSIYTNYVAKMNLRMADYLSCVAGRQPDEVASQRRSRVAEKLHMVFNSSGQYHPEYEGYDHVETAWRKSQEVKQADTVMLGYPLGMDMPDQIRRNDLTLYGERTNHGGPAMTWSMFAINWLDLGETHLAAVNFNKSYQWYIRKPFNVWTEAKAGMGASNFITGMGGFLQAVLFGYGGFRIELDRVTFAPHLLPGTTQLRLTGVKYLGASLDLLVTAERVLFTVRQMSRQFPLQLRVLSTGATWRLKAGLELSLNREKFEVSSLTLTDCPLPQGSSCPDVVSGDNDKGREPMMPANIGRVHVMQTGGDRCGDYLLCSQKVQQNMAGDDSVNFYIGNDNRVYQGAAVSPTAGVMKVAMVGDYTVRGMSLEQTALLHRLLKCGMERSNIDPEYRLHYVSQRPEDCGKAPCAGNSLHCQLKEFRHWDPSTQEGQIQPDCGRQTANHPITPFSTPTPTLPSRRSTPHKSPSVSRRSPPIPYTSTPTLQQSPSSLLGGSGSQCPPVRPVQVTCNCQSGRLLEASSGSSAVGAVRVISPGLGCRVFVVAIFGMVCLQNLVL